MTSRSRTVLRPVMRIPASSTSTRSMTAREVSAAEGRFAGRTFLRMTSDEAAIISGVIRGARARFGNGPVIDALCDVALGFDGGDAIFQHLVGVRSAMPLSMAA